jgi:hypothetical protein
MNGGMNHMKVLSCFLKLKFGMITNSKEGIQCRASCFII